MSIAAPAIAQSGPLGRRAIIHTTKGDVFVDLFPDLTPKTVENFVGLSRKNYYDDVIFHRVIPKFVSLACLLLVFYSLLKSSKPCRCFKLETH